MIDYPFKTHGSLYTLLHSSKILELYSVENVKTKSLGWETPVTNEGERNIF